MAPDNVINILNEIGLTDNPRKIRSLSRFLFLWGNSTGLEKCNFSEYESKKYQSIHKNFNEKNHGQTRRPNKEHSAISLKSIRLKKKPEKILLIHLKFCVWNFWKFCYYHFALNLMSSFAVDFINWAPFVDYVRVFCRSFPFFEDFQINKTESVKYYDVS